MIMIKAVFLSVFAIAAVCTVEQTGDGQMGDNLRRMAAERTLLRGVSPALDDVITARIEVWIKADAKAASEGVKGEAPTDPVDALAYKWATLAEFSPTLFDQAKRLSGTMSLNDAVQALESPAQDIP